MNTYYKTTEAVKNITRSRKHQFSFGTSEQPQNTDSYWSGGSRSEYSVYNMDTNKFGFPPAGKYPWTTENRYTLQPGDVLIETGTFCGKPATPRFTCLPADEARAKAWLGIK